MAQQAAESGLGHLLLSVPSTLLVVAFQVPFLKEKLSVDEAVYYVVASSKALPYVQVFDQKPPLVYVWYRLALALNGGMASELAIHALATLALVVSALLVYATGVTLV